LLLLLDLVLLLISLSSPDLRLLAAGLFDLVLDLDLEIVRLGGGLLVLDLDLDRDRDLGGLLRSLLLDLDLSWTSMETLSTAFL